MPRGATSGRDPPSLRTPRLRAELDALLERAEACALAGKAEEGLALAAQAERSARRLGDELRVLHALRLQGTLARMAAQYEEARPLLEAARSGYERLGAGQWLAECAAQQGQMALDCGDAAEAVGCFAAGLEYAREDGCELVRSRLLTGLGIASARVGDHDRAERAYREALALQRDLGNEAAIANTLHCLGVLELRRIEAGDTSAVDEGRTQRLERAGALLNESLKLAQRLGRRRLEGMCLNELGRTHRLAGRFSAAIESSEQALAIFRALPAPRDECETELQLAHTHLAEGKLDLAYAHAHAALATAQRCGFRPCERDAHLLLMRCAEEAGQVATALAHLKRARAIELELRDSEVLRRLEQLDFAHALARSEAERAALAARAQWLGQLAATDPLTGLANRRGFSARFEERTRDDRHAVLLLIDIDHFKQINDAHGHSVGDNVLTRVATAIVQACRELDLVGRWGGEEFLVLLEETDLDTAVAVAGRIQQSVARIDWSDIAQPLAVTLSIGVAQRHPGEGLTALIQRADQALYEAKQRGRDRVVLALPEAHGATTPRTQNDTTAST
ncbi:MAG: diguanylate cyclase [Casimicrobiaceae bacterium]|nr:diguanylate cyclase [Casimicrobiaceae bacterium]